MQKPTFEIKENVGHVGSGESIAHITLKKGSRERKCRNQKGNLGIAFQIRSRRGENIRSERKAREVKCRRRDVYGLVRL